MWMAISIVVNFVLTYGLAWLGLLIWRYQADVKRGYLRLWVLAIALSLLAAYNFLVPFGPTLIVLDLVTLAIVVLIVVQSVYYSIQKIWEASVQSFWREG